jgi:hypothetical protein
MIKSYLEQSVNSSFLRSYSNRMKSIIKIKIERARIGIWSCIYGQNSRNCRRWFNGAVVSEYETSFVA